MEPAAVPPPMWRPELWHPKIVHFPVALLIVAAGLFLIRWFLFNRASADRLHFSGRICLALGTLGAWAALWTGDIADGVVGRTLCDPLVLEDHEYFSYILAYLATGALVADGLDGILPLRYRRLFAAGVTLVLLVCMGLVGTIGHLGGKLVYQQAAGVYHPSEDCREFGPGPSP